MFTNDDNSTIDLDKVLAVEKQLRAAVTAAMIAPPWPSPAMDGAVWLLQDSFEENAKNAETDYSTALSTTPSISGEELGSGLPDHARERMLVWEARQRTTETIFGRACVTILSSAAGGNVTPAWSTLLPFISATTPPTSTEQLAALSLAAALSWQSSTQTLELLELLLAHHTISESVRHAALVLQIRFELLAGRSRDPEAVFQAVVQPARSTFQQAAAQLVMAQVIMSTRGPRHALHATQQAVTASARAYDRRTLAQALQMQAHLTATLGDPHAARPLYETSLQLHYAVGDLRRAGMAEGGLATLRDELGDPFAARRGLRRALKLHRHTGNRRSEAILLCNLAILEERLGSCSRTQARFEQALEICRQIGDKLVGGTITVNLADHMQKIGDLVRANELYEEALRLQRATGHRRFEGITLMNQARLHANTGAPQHAARLFEQALATFRDVGDRVSEAETLSAFGALAESSGRLEDATEMQRQAGEIHRRADNRAGAAEAMVALGNLYRHRNDFARAAAAYAEALTSFTELRRPLGIGVCHRCRAALLLDQGETAAAEEAARAACRVLEPLGDLREEQRARHILGRILRVRGAYSEAAAQFSRALDAIEEWIRAIGNDWRRLRVLDEALPLYAESVDLLFGDSDDPEQAFIIAERAKARSLRRLIQNTPPAAVTPLDTNRAADSNSDATPTTAALAERRLGLELHLRSLQEALLEQKTKVGAASGMIAYLEKELQRVRAEHQQLLDQITFSHPSYAAARGWTPPLSPTAVQTEVVAAPGTALIEYFISDQHLYVWLLRADHFHAQQLAIAPAALATLVKSVVAPLCQVPPRLFRVSPRNLRQLARVLIDPLLPLLEGIDRLLLVPSDVLYELPFEMLVLQLPGEAGWHPPATHDRFTAALYLSERFDLAYSPSATLFANTRPAPSATSSHPLPTILALADPLYPEASSIPPPGLYSTAPTTTKLPALSLPSLPGTRQELDILRTLFPSVHAFTGADARKSTYRRRAASADLIHLGCHGLVHSEDPAYTGVILSPGHNRQEDAWLQAYEIAEIPLPRSPIVVISACRVAGGRLSSAEGLLGLSRAFLQAGASCVAASLWPIHDATTVALITNFYRALADTPELDPIAAFGRARRLWIAQQRAQPDLRSGAPPSHPYFWAGFRVHGGR
jgi:CHAT domain-containing protein/Tfp pilus assembly protein PilF